MSEIEWVFIGNVGKAHGIKGAVHVHLDNADSSILDDCMRKKSEIKVDGKMQRLTRVFANGTRCEFDGVTDRNHSELLRNKEIHVRREDFSPLKDDEYYLTDLLGAEIFDVEGNLLGPILRFEDFGSYPIAVISFEDKEIMCPLVPDLIEELDSEAKRIVYSAPEGLFNVDDKKEKSE